MNEGDKLAQEVYTISFNRDIPDTVRERLRYMCSVYDTKKECLYEEESTGGMVQVTLQKRICAGVGYSPADIVIHKNIMMPMYPQIGWDIEGETIEKICFEDGRLWFLVEDDCHFEGMLEGLQVIEKETMDAHVAKYLDKGWV